MRAYQEALHELAARDATLVAVSPQLPDGSLSFAETNALDFHVLSDVGNAVARAYGLVWKLPPPLVDLYRERGIDLVAANGNDDWELPVPGTFVVDRDGLVRFASVDPDYRNRVDGMVLLAAVDRLS